MGQSTDAILAYGIQIPEWGYEEGEPPWDSQDEGDDNAPYYDQEGYLAHMLGVRRSDFAEEDFDGWWNAKREALIKCGVEIVHHNIFILTRCNRIALYFIFFKKTWG